MYSQFFDSMNTRIARICSGYAPRDQVVSTGLVWAGIQEDV
ncbi:MAG: hypothetical protein ABIK28_15820 [Planctomycetota bacterium]